MILTINGKQAALKKGSSIEYVSENRIFTDADDYSMEIELPLADCPQNIAIFGMITRKDVDIGDIFFDAVLQDTSFFIITPISDAILKKSVAVTPCNLQNEGVSSFCCWLLIGC